MCCCERHDHFEATQEDKVKWVSMNVLSREEESNYEKKDMKHTNAIQPSLSYHAHTSTPSQKIAWIQCFY